MVVTTLQREQARPAAGRSPDKLNQDLTAAVVDAIVATVVSLEAVVLQLSDADYEQLMRSLWETGATAEIQKHFDPLRKQ